MSELRKDPVTGRWVIISTERGKRPSSFPVRLPKVQSSTCPFCYGNESMTPPEIVAFRSPGLPPNSTGWQTRVIPNKFPLLGIDEEQKKQGIGMYDMITGFGAHEVIIETPDHIKNTQDLTVEELARVLTCAQDRIEDLYRDIRFRYVLFFKNDGESAGASLEHSHSQLIATPIIPKRVKEELEGSQKYFEQKERCVFCDIITQETDVKKRVIYENDHFVAFCPFSSRFPFEIWLLPKKHEIDFHTSRAHSTSMAQALKTVLLKLARVLNEPQYNFLIHTSPNRIERRGYWNTIQDDYHWHFEIIPRLIRTAGFEWGTGFYVNPTPPEDAAKYLREADVQL